MEIKHSPIPNDVTAEQLLVDIAAGEVAQETEVSLRVSPKPSRDRIIEVASVFSMIPDYMLRS